MKWATINHNKGYSSPKDDALYMVEYIKGVHYDELFLESKANDLNKLKKKKKKVKAEKV